MIGAEKVLADLLANMPKQSLRARKSGFDEERSLANQHTEHWLKDFRWRCWCRKWLTPCLFALVFLWLVFIGVLVWMDADACVNMELSDTVLVSLIAGGSANVIGMFLIVARYLFPIGGEKLPTDLSNASSPRDSDE